MKSIIMPNKNASCGAECVNKGKEKTGLAFLWCHSFALVSPELHDSRRDAEKMVGRSEE